MCISVFWNLQFIDLSSGESHSLDFDGPKMFTQNYILILMLITWIVGRVSFLQLSHCDQFRAGFKINFIF